MLAAKKNKKPKSRTRKVAGFLHLWLGLASGLVVFILGVTGCLYVFQKEISDVIYSDQLYVKPPKNAVALPLTQLKQIAEKALNSPNVTATTYADPEKAWEFMYYKAGNDRALTFFGTVEAYKSAFINPYTGQVTGIMDYEKNFFVIVKYLHWSLLLNTQYGQPVVGYSTLVFVIMLITGMILWWPKNLKRNNLNKSFKVKWKAKFKRLNYDLHNVPGFYAMLITLVLALTGMVWAMKWFQTLVYVVASQSITPPKPNRLSSDSTAVAIKEPLNIAFETARKQFPDAKRIALSAPDGNSKAAVIRAFGYRGKENYYDVDALQFDQFTGKLLGRENFKDKNNGEKLIRMNYDIHVGAVLGLPGKILAFFASLIAASLPITGFIIWWGRGKKKKAAI
ncbi:PepSY-associated TM helix domain-containing protein [Pedobacter heparinus]|uniref:Transmembrane protein n=1 Tax=Pedobacter heparinus (strain ATCC 13125 / DSM 2366 / CIP 104194 / JCM 7457 / NBRC 12017 / NCIMB 9290 / NRRL B-14731 / HIM 762-3) TaxID=485917 RepID=C6XYF9_PEDHD|nr:PepSY-associated TM helix domain-containing protein [Pedobacter heparinus]ACU02426.1 transmembrane protein [Pedobacter heparinus DSM 2366]